MDVSEPLAPQELKSVLQVCRTFLPIDFAGMRRTDRSPQGFVFLHRAGLLANEHLSLRLTAPGSGKACQTLSLGSLRFRPDPYCRAVRMYSFFQPFLHRVKRFVRFQYLLISGRWASSSGSHEFEPVREDRWAGVVDTDTRVR